MEWVLQVIDMRMNTPTVRRISLLIGLGALVALPLSLIIALAYSLNRGAAAPPASGPRHAATQAVVRWAPTTLRLQTDALGIDPVRRDHLYAGTPDGLWQSADAGATWTRARVVAAPPEFLSFAARTSGDLLYAGASDGTIYARDPAAGTWRRIVASLDGSSVFSLAGVPGAAPTLLAGTGNGIYRIAYAGSRWHVDRVASTGGSSVTSILVLPWKPRVVYASIFGTRPPVLRSGDGGRRWQPYMQGLPSALPSEQLLAVALSKSVILSTMGIGVWQISPGHGWSEISAGLPERHAMPLAVATNGGVHLYAGTMGSGVYTRGTSQPWRRLGNQLVGPTYIDLGLQVAGAQGQYLVAATSQGVYRLALGR